MMFQTLQQINQRPEPFSCYTADQLWTDEYVSSRMLEFHLNENLDISSRNHAFMDKSADWMVSRFSLGRDTEMCDFGCGPGLYASRLARRGVRVTGIDFSPSSIAYAKNVAAQEKLDIDYVCQDYLSFASDRRFDLISMIFCDFCALSPKQRASLMAKWRGLLGPEGAVLLDVFSLRQYEATEEKALYEYLPDGGFWTQEPCYVFQNTFKYETEKVFLDKYVIYEQNRTRQIFNWLKCYSLDALKQELADNGFSITEHYANVAGEPYRDDAMEMAVVAQKTS
jgi:cyclopropane fatty-acyl-phospholipid synthase-like methyltransferase